jgi:hypothetical protein
LPYNLEKPRKNLYITFVYKFILSQNKVLKAGKSTGERRRGTGNADTRRL